MTRRAGDASEQATPAALPSVKEGSPHAVEQAHLRAWTAPGPSAARYLDISLTTVALPAR